MAKLKDLILSLVVVAVTCCQLVSGRNEGATAANEFAGDFSKAVMGKSKPGGSPNLFYSPISVYLAFAMTYAGAKGKTARQLERVLKWSQLGSKGHAAIEELTDSVIKSLSKNQQTLGIANKLWLQEFFCTSRCDKFKNILNKQYDADIGLIDFAGNSSGALHKINKWVEQKTAHKIKDLLKPGMIDIHTRLVITNAIYFKSNWKYQFDPTQTFPVSFFTTSSNEINVPMMHLTGNFPYYQDDHYKVLELPYAVPELAMTLLLPREMNAISNLQKDFDMNFVNRYISLLRKRKVKVAIPKFKITAELDLKDILQTLGIRDLFGADADLSGITGYRGLIVTDAIHKAFVDVTEKGTEAAAATAVKIGFRSFSPNVFIFNANHPFVFLIRHIPSSAVLFIGQVVNPVA